MALVGAVGSASVANSAVLRLSKEGRPATTEAAPPGSPFPSGNTREVEQGESAERACKATRTLACCSDAESRATFCPNDAASHEIPATACTCPLCR